MKKLEATIFTSFKVVTEAIICCFLALCLSPQHMLLKIEILGTQIAFEVKELVELPISFIVIFLIALIFTFIFVLIFSFSRLKW